jgi:hypothetical protein
VNEALHRLELPVDPDLLPWQLDLLNLLEQESGATIKLGIVFHRLRRTHSSLAVSEFHDGLITLRDRGSVTLATIENPTDQIVEPEHLLLDNGTLYGGVIRGPSLG